MQDKQEYLKAIRKILIGHEIQGTVFSDSNRGVRVSMITRLHEVEGEVEHLTTFWVSWDDEDDGHAKRRGSYTTLESALVAALADR